MAAARDPGGEKHALLALDPQDDLGRPFFFLADFFRVSLDRLSERELLVV